MQQNIMRNWSVLFIIVSLSWQNNFSQNSQSTTSASKIDTANYQSALTEYIVEFFDYQKFSEALALMNMFNDTVTQDSIKIFENKLGVNIDLVCYFDPVVNSFWPNLFGGIALGFPNNDDIIVQLKYTPDSSNPVQNTDNSSTKKYYKIQANVTGNEYYNLKLLKNYLDYNLQNKVTLDHNDIKYPVFFSLNSFLYGENTNLLCDESPAKDYVRKAIDSLKTEIIAELNDYDKENEQNEDSTNTGFTVNSYISDSSQILMISSIPKKFTLAELEKLKDDPYFGQLYTYLEEYKQEMEKRRQLLPELDKYYSKEKLCQLVNEIESAKEGTTKELYELINKNSPENKIIDWLKPYLENRLAPVAQ